MNDLTKKDYVAKISNATELELVNITFDLIFENIEYAINNKSDYKIYKSYVLKAKSFVENLMDSLDSDKAISDSLYHIYSICRGTLTKASLSSMNTHDLEDCKVVLLPIKEAFLSLEDIDKVAVMKNNQKVYAGLTYGKKGLDEFVDRQSKSFEV
ncbi:MAG: flagellar protein FliS [Lachnospirales bacterium]